MNRKSRRAGRVAAWGHAADLRHNFTTTKEVRPVLETMDRQPALYRQQPPLKATVSTPMSMK